MPIINENQLDDWVRGHSREAQGVIVELIYRLVAASCPRPTERRFPLGDSIGQHGPDGMLCTPIDFEPFVPEGKSYWEIGTGLGAREKATEDYRGLTEGVPEPLRREGTFVFVTPLSARRDWEQTWKAEAQGAWIEDRRARKEWKSVRVLDGTRLVDWLHQLPAVEFWLASKLGLPTQGLRTVEEFWADIRSIGEPPPLIPRVFLGNRDEAGSRLKDVFEWNALQLKFATHHPDQVADFISAYAASMETEAQMEARGRAVIVSNSAAWESMCSLPIRHILVADSGLDLNGSAGTKLIQRARRAGHSIVFAGPRGGIPDPTRVDLLSPRAHQVREALVVAGYAEERARLLAQRSSGNVSTLLRCIQNLSLLPEWAESSAAAELAIAAFLGSWVDGLEADQASVETVAGKSYGEWIAKIRENAAGSNTPLAQYERHWKFLTRYEGWYVLGPRLFNDHLDRLRQVAMAVLSERDPQFDLPPEDRFAAAIYGKTFKHSRLLRNGIAESLALLGCHGRALTSCSPGKAKGIAAIVVGSLLGEASWELWASLNDVLPLLAESAPDEFLNSFERALSATPCPFDAVFSQEGHAIVGSNYMTGLLWALETLAWDPADLGRVALGLARLAERDPGGQWGNRPMNSLVTILLPWLPQTCADSASCVRVVKAVVSEVPKVGWNLLLALLPASHSTSSGSRRPEWRETIPEERLERTSNEDYENQVSAYADLAVDVARFDTMKLAELCARLDELPPAAYRRVLEHLESDAVRTLSESERVLVWSKVTALGMRHRRHSDADWSLSAEDVNLLLSVADKIAPRVPFYQHQRLFSDDWGELLESRGEYHQQVEDLDRRRESAVAELLTEGGLSQVLKFARTVDAPWRVGIAMGTVGPAEVDEQLLPEYLNDADKAVFGLVNAFARARLNRFGWGWFDRVSLFVGWTREKLGRMLALLPFSAEAWSRATALLGAEDALYWDVVHVNSFELRGDFDVAAGRLIRHGRPRAALRCLHRMLDLGALDLEMTAEALLSATTSKEQVQLDRYECVQLIRALQSDGRSNRESLFRIEWAYLPLLDRNSGTAPITIERHIAEDPGEYCKVLRLVYRPEGTRNEEEPVDAVDDSRKAIAVNAYRLLHGWSTPPGLRVDSEYQGGFLDSWLAAVKADAGQTGHLDIAMYIVGQVLKHVPPDPDGLWINRSVAKVLDAQGAETMRSGFKHATMNARGAHWVEPTGKPERELAAKYRSMAQSLVDAGYNRFAVTMRELGESYERDATRVAGRHEFED